MKKNALLIFWLFLFFSPRLIFAGQGFFYKELNLIGGYSERSQWIGKSETLENSLGIESYRKFSNDYGDYLTADLQLRLAYDSTENSHHAWGFQVHNAWLKYKLGLGNNFIIGHFDPFFGLEPVLDTHGTILQTLMMKNLGFNKDWGAGFSGQIGEYDYGAALQLGSGMSIYTKKESFLATGRLSRELFTNFTLGASLLYGEVLSADGMNTLPRPKLVLDETSLKKRIGLDGQYLLGSYTHKAELAFGKERRQDVLGYLYEVDYIFSKLQNLALELQFQSWINDLDKHGSDDSTLSLGTSYKLNNKITLRLAYIQDLNLYMGNEDKKVLLQFYYYGT